MIIVRIRGGFGNQLFTYAFGYAYAKMQNENLVLDLTDYESGYFRDYKLQSLSLHPHETVKNKIITSRFHRFLYSVKNKLTYNYIKEENYSKKFRNLFPRKDTYLFGYWQSESFFCEFKQEILEQFQPKQYSQNVHYFLFKVKEQSSVSLHIRRGDYLKQKWSISMDFYRKAIDTMRNFVNNPVFYVFSDDKNWCRENFKGNDFFIVDFDSSESEVNDLDDFFCMTFCDHNIIANSSFSWWAAYLNKNQEKIVIAPKIHQWAGNFYPKEWILIEVN